MSASSANNGPQRPRRRAPLAARRPAPPPPNASALPKRPPEPAGLRHSDGKWLTLAEAAEAAEVSPGTIRQWRKAGTIAERRSPDHAGTVEVFLTPDDGWAADDPPAGAAGDDGVRSESGVLVPLEIHQRSLAELILRLTDTTERAVRAEARVEILEAQLSEFRPSRTGTAATLASPPPRRRK